MILFKHFVQLTLNRDFLSALRSLPLMTNQVNKLETIIKSSAKSLIIPLPYLIHLFVTDRCNLSCAYCYSRDNSQKDPTLEELLLRIKHAKKLGTAIISLMGGEPTLRTDLPQIIQQITDLGIYSYLTTNGKLLNEKKIITLAKSGLDFLELSMDGYDEVEGSFKTIRSNEHIIEDLKVIKKNYGLKFKLHQVLTPYTLDETEKLLEFTKEKNIPISLGMAYPLSKDLDFKKLKSTLQRLIEDYPPNLINPKSYFAMVLKNLEGKKELKCDVGKYSLAISTAGEIYLCSKLEQLRGIDFLELDASYFKNNQHWQNTSCGINCLSACAYSAHYFREHPLELMKKFYKQD